MPTHVEPVGHIRELKTLIVESLNEKEVIHYLL